MTIFSFETTNTPELHKFIADFKERIAGGNIVKNPFTGCVREIYKDKNTVSYVLKIEPVYPKVYLMGYVLIAGAVMFGRGLTLWILPGIFLLSYGLLWSKFFYFIFLKLGLSKAGHRNKLKFVTNRETLEKIINTVI